MVSLPEDRAAMLVMGTAEPEGTRFEAARAEGEGAVRSSCREFHSLQSEHFPIQRGNTAPQDWQT